MNSVKSYSTSNNDSDSENSDCCSNNEDNSNCLVSSSINNIKQKVYRVKNDKWKCSVCEIFCNSESQYEVHMLSQKHKITKDKIKHKQLAAKCHIDVNRYLIPEDKRIGKNQKFGFYCICCDAYMTGQIQLIMHVKGAKHQHFYPNEVPGYRSSKPYIIRRKNKKRKDSRNQIQSYTKNDMSPHSYHEFSKNHKLYKNESIMNNGLSGTGQIQYNSNTHLQNCYSNRDYCQQAFVNATSIGTTQSQQGTIYPQRYQQPFSTLNNTGSNSSRSYTMKFPPTNGQNYQIHSNHQRHPLNNNTTNTANQSANMQASHIYYSIPNNSFYYSINTNPSTGIASINPQYTSAFSHHPHTHHHMPSSYNNLQQTDGYRSYPNVNGMPVTAIRYNTTNNHPTLTTATTNKNTNYFKQFQHQTPTLAKQIQQIIVQPRQKYFNDRQNLALMSSSSTSITQTSSAQSSGHNSNFTSKDIQQQQTPQSNFYLNQDTNNTTTTLYLNSLNQTKSNLWTTDAEYETHAVCNTPGDFT